MNHAERAALLQPAISSPGGVWGDFGAGWGDFTVALRELIGDRATIYAIDRDPKAFVYLCQAHGDNGSLHTITADFTQPLDLPPLDGILMTNALHFVATQQATLERIRAYLRPQGRLILVEYDVHNPVSWIPHPIPEAKFAALVTSAGFVQPQIVARRTSPRTGGTMYTGLALHPSP